MLSQVENDEKTGALLSRALDMLRTHGGDQEKLRLKAGGGSDEEEVLKIIEEIREKVRSTKIAELVETRDHDAHHADSLPDYHEVAEAPWRVAEWAVALRFDNPRATVLVLVLG